jgi:hypothetical protein
MRNTNIQKMTSIGFGMIMKKAEYPFYEFSSKSLITLNHDTDSWLVVLKDSIRSFHPIGLDQVNVSTLNSQHNNLLQEFTNYIVDEGKSNLLVNRPDWILFPLYL